MVNPGIKTQAQLAELGEALSKYRRVTVKVFWWVGVAEMNFSCFIFPACGIADALEALGHDVQRGYQVGPWTVDVVLPNLRAPFGLECSLHSAGAQATLQRRHMLADLGWTILPMHEASWSNEATDAALYVAETIRLDRALRP